MDKLDIEIIKLLQEDGRMTISQLSQALSLSRPSVTERLHRLCDHGVIEGFSARISLPAIGRNILVMIQISQIRTGPDEFETMVAGHPDILECHRVTGSVSYFLKAAVSNMSRLTKLVDHLVPYGTINTSVVLCSPVSYRPVVPEKAE
ncbi:MAG TPA: Lrp/AsnC family transcriptional regulator [Firmicutes bacterium]|jgi:Lrp/AsnC family transcriptional regulator, leucine-responsive regulatory protein|nr:Lrp/AsnC family transcriptional regulator [Bacillota bacterium]